MVAPSGPLDLTVTLSYVNVTPTGLGPLGDRVVTAEYVEMSDSTQHLSRCRSCSCTSETSSHSMR